MSTADKPILVAVTDPVLHPEAIHVATVTGRPVIDMPDPEEVNRHARRAHAVLVDSDGAGCFRSGARHPHLYLLAADPGPVDWRTAMSCHAEAAFVLPAQSPELLAALGDQTTTDTRGRVLGILGAVGGAGTSTLAAAVARELADDRPLLIDAVDKSGGLDLLLCMEDTPGARWPEVTLGRGRVELDDLRNALPRSADGITVLSAARSRITDPFTLDSGTLAAALTCVRSGSGTAVLDLPAGARGADLAVECCDLVILLVPAEVRAVAAAASLTAKFAARKTPVCTVLRHRGWSGIDVAEMERFTATDCLAELGQIAGLAKSCEIHGLPMRPPKALAVVARAAVAEFRDL
ncbi:septum site-determining protein Ssd [Corynebacterium sp. CCM 9204]|uniref:septum site-determining protein Ssd n=1 Tax=Corynebacterium sp. CCM 9204 TaxID=3057616 RepID=UPI0035254DA7